MQEPQTVYVVKIEYESGSDNGEVVCVMSVHRTKAGAGRAVDEWNRSHDGCDMQEAERGEMTEEEDGSSRFVFLDEDGEESHYCPGCGWGADWTTASLEE